MGSRVSNQLIVQNRVTIVILSVTLEITLTGLRTARTIMNVACFDKLPSAKKLTRDRTNGEQTKGIERTNDLNRDVRPFVPLRFFTLLH